MSCLSLSPFFAKKGTYSLRRHHQKKVTNVFVPLFLSLEKNVKTTTANAQPANTTLKSAKHLSPPKKTTTKANTNDDSDDEWESWGCSSEDSNVAAEARRRSEQHTKKTSERASVPLRVKNSSACRRQWNRLRWVPVTVVSSNKHRGRRRRIVREAGSGVTTTIRKISPDYTERPRPSARRLRQPRK